MILSLETSTEVCSVAIHHQGILVAERETHEPQSHSSKLGLFISEVLDQSNISPKQLQAVVVSGGPGSYTGLRIGASTAKGICLGLDIPLIAVGTLELMASQVISSWKDPGLFCPMIDARRMEVYCMLLDHDKKVVIDTHALVVTGESFAALLEKTKIVFFGNGSQKCRSILQHPNACFMENIFPQASHLGELGYQKFNRGAVEDLVSYEPFYLKSFEVKLPKSYF